MLLKYIFVLLMCAFVVEGTKTGTSILKHKKSIDSWNEFYVHYFGSSTVLATNWWDLWSFYFFGQFDLPMTTYEHNNLNSNLTESCDTNDVVEVNSQENIIDEICSTCADELSSEEEIETMEEKCTKCEDEEKNSKVDEINFQLPETSEDQSTFQIDDESDTVVEDTIENVTITKSDVVENNLIRINQENEDSNNFELNPIVINDGDADTLEVDISDGTEPKSELLDYSNRTILKDDDESSFLPVKLDELQEFSISNETQTNDDEQNSINNEELNTIHDAIIPVTSSCVTESRGNVSTEYVESKNDLIDEDLKINLNESEIIENIIDKVATSNLESINQVRSVQFNGDESVNEEHTVSTTTSDDIFNSNNDTIIKEDDSDRRIVIKNEELSISTEILDETSNTIIIVDSNITKELPNNVTGNETQLEDDQAKIHIKENSPTIENMNEDNSGIIDISREVNYNNIINDTINVQDEIIVEALNSNENTELSVVTNVKVVQESALLSENQDQSYEVSEDSALIEESFVSETSVVNNEEEDMLCNSSDVQEIKSNTESIENNGEKNSFQDSDNLQSSAQTYNLNEGNSFQLETCEEIEKNNIELLKSNIESDENSITIQTDILPKIDENVINIVTDDDIKEISPLFIPQDNTIVEQTIGNLSDDTNNEVIIDANSNNTNNLELSAQLLDFNDSKTIENAAENNIKHDSGSAEDSIMEFENISDQFIITEQSVVKSNTVMSEDSNMVSNCLNDTEDNTENNKAEDSKKEPQTKENVNEEFSVVTTLLVTEDKSIDQLETINSFESDYSSTNESGIENTVENLNTSTPDDSKTVVSGSNDNELKLEDNSQNEAEDFKEEPQTNENINEEMSVETNNPFESNSISTNKNGIENTVENVNTSTPDDFQTVVSRSNDTEYNSNNIEAEDSKEEPQTNENINEEISVVSTIHITEDKSNDQLGTINSFESDYSSTNENGIENTVENLNTSTPEDSKIVVSGSNDTEYNSNNIEAEDSKETLEAYENVIEENNVEITSVMTEDKMENVYSNTLVNSSDLNREENRFSNGTNNNIEISGQILNPAPVLHNTRVPSKSGFMSHFF